MIRKFARQASRKIFTKPFNTRKLLSPGEQARAALLVLCLC